MQTQNQTVSEIVELTIVLPIRDEAPVLRQTLDELCRVFAAFSAEIIAVIDARSIDSSAEVLEEYASGDGPVRIRVIPADPPQCGSGTARALGSRASRAKLIGWIDADGTYAASDLRHFAETIGSADQVVGTRSRDFGALGFLRFLVKSAIAKAAALLWRRLDLIDLNSGLRVFKREALVKWLHELPQGFSCTTTATLAALNHGQAVRFSPITYHPRHARTKSKFHPLLDTARLIRVVWGQWRLKPPRSGAFDKTR